MIFLNEYLIIKIVKLKLEDFKRKKKSQEGKGKAAKKKTNKLNE